MNNTTAYLTHDSDDKHAIKIHNLTVQYGNSEALHNISANILYGSLNAIVGPNGSGKSTLLKILNAIVPIHKGTVSIAQPLHNSIGYLPQKSEVDTYFPITVKELVAMGFCHHHGLFTKINDQMLSEVMIALSEVNMQQHAHKWIHDLSGGQFQRVLFARLILQNADLILLDEPFTAVDQYTIEELLKLIMQWHKQGKTILVVNHEMDLVKKYFPNTILLAKKLIAYDQTNKVITNDNIQKARSQS